MCIFFNFKSNYISRYLHNWSSQGYVYSFQLLKVHVLVLNIVIDIIFIDLSKR